MKILYVDQSGQLGGGELAILPWLRAHPHGARVVLFEDGPFRKSVEHCGIPVDVLALETSKPVRREAGILSLFTALPSLLSLRSRLRERVADFDLLYANSQKAFLLTALSKRRGQPLLWHLRDILTAEHFGTILQRVAIIAGNRYATVIIANSQATADAFIAAGGKRDKIRVVHDGIGTEAFDNLDTAAIRKVREELGNGTHPLIGVFGRLSPWKGQHILLDALRTIPNAHAIVVGDALFGETAYAESLRELANEPEVAGRVHFLGFRRDIPSLMKAMDIIVHTSTSPEPFGLVIVEGMLARKPVIASRAGGAVEIIEDGKSGLLVTPSSVPELRSALVDLLVNPAKATLLAQAGRRRAESKFSLKAMFSGISAVIRETGSDAEDQSPTEQLPQ